MSFGEKSPEKLYQTDGDPYSMKNIADDPAFAKIKKKLKLELELKNQK
jgi:hypothetical protein